MAEKERVVQTRLGEMTIAESGIIHFPKGIIGFETQKEFSLLQIREESPFLLLQCVSDPRLGLVVTDPYSFMEDYEIHVGEAEQSILDIQDVEQVAVLVTVSIPQGRPNETTLNLSGPILINSESKVGLQVPQTNPNYPSNHKVYLEEPID